ncbi:hypothetical protein FRB93_009082 [Tulasnella sp. JGI-2019a]|nr:hypothetical protein FRB93_009082 [Tulasnella sp. JGI-2019a]
MIFLFSTVVFGLLAQSVQHINAHSTLSRVSPHTRATDVSHSLNVASCPGYTLSGLKNSKNGLIAKLTLAGSPCNAFGSDISDLTIQVTYETSSRLHVNIFDTAKAQFTVPDFIIPSSSLASSASSSASSSDLVFNYTSKPFAFWITRRSDPSGTPLFDTRLSSLPTAPVSEIVPGDNTTALNGFQLVFENQYLQLTSSLPHDTNIYGIGEVIASSGIRRAITGNGTIQTMWARDIGDPVDQNEYGIHPVYIEHRYNNSTGKSSSHGVFLNSAAGSDVMLFSPTSSQSLIQYRQIGGTLDLFFYSGPTPQAVIEQHGAVVGKPTWVPAWGLGFHLCRWGYANISETMEQVTKMREANIPLEVMWNDIDLYHAYRDFTVDPVSFPGSEMKAFMAELTKNHQHYIPIVDAAIPVLTNKTDVYDPYTEGRKQDVFLKNPDGSEYVGQVWPGYTTFPDWFAKNTISWWTDALRNWTTMGVNFSGIWLDMNEVSSFCEGSCGIGANLSNTSTPFILPGEPGNLITNYPECYNATISGPSGNITVNGTLTCNQTESSTQQHKREVRAPVELKTSKMQKRGLGSAAGSDVNLNYPPYTIHNGYGKLSLKTVATNATHAGGYVELDTHNLFGTTEEHATFEALLSINAGKRPFIIGRSTFAGAGKWSGHWTGDNYASWESQRYSIQGILQFQIFQIPLVGADTCGFNDNTDEELCNRWMQLSAFAPFYRNHNIKGAISQEPYRWDSVAEASRTAINIRYTLLPYWYTLFANASLYGSPVARALFFEFPDQPELFSVDRQFFVGSDILVTPVLEPGASSVQGYFPGQGQVIWRDWYTHGVVNASSGPMTTLSAPLGHINVHIRDGSAILCSGKPAYTIEETRQGPYSLLVSLTSNGGAFGTAYVDDGESYPPGPSRTLTFQAVSGKITIASKGAYTIGQKLEVLTILGVTQKPNTVKVNGKAVVGWTYSAGQQEVVLSNAGLDLNQGMTTLSWA